MTFDPKWLLELPPILENPKDVLLNYILHQHLPIQEPQMSILPHQADVTNLYNVPRGAASTTLLPDRDPISGDILDFIEVSISDSEKTAKNSMSLRRQPGPPENATRGNAINFPFWPGGFDEPEQRIESLHVDNSIFETDLLTTPPGFANGLDFDNDVLSIASKATGTGAAESVNLLSIIEEDHNILGMWKEEQKTEAKASGNKFEYNEELDEIILKTPDTKPILEISKSKKKRMLSMEWAEWVDITQPVLDFNTQIPEPAHTYPFELDIFQKQAIIKLENHNHVFVAAHTSAGKTVVAEYAIALSQKHMTRTIYTSPIKALSNQKYRDFKKTFGDVGLITGDIQINPSSACLIMTTEILRSMLYCGSEVTRDLEYVIFDEVHYITDLERGHVWEEVLILLPDHVNIIMLSATVPNALEFSNWVGMTKRKKVYVISTLKRPVPLKHHLYTGHSKETKNELFLLVESDGRFITDGYRKAKEAKAKQQSKQSNKVVKDAKGNPRQGYKSNFMSPKHEAQLWLTLVDFLRQKNELPVIAFSLSRAKCDRYVKSLESCSLTTGAEAGKIKTFFAKCLSKLKPEDQKIPQVLMLQDSLVRGIGVHHSGILPILKEVVELLFQRGYVKLLFATETFAMGVNMPARTVVFDSFKKHDGKELRHILPAEYTQMAGRAGRRGLDENGTVIMLCKTDVPHEEVLKEIITGRPKKLESKFRLTYAMILNLFRVESVTVEDMMSHSFKEFESQSKKPDTLAQLEKAEKLMSKIPALGEHSEPLCKFYECAYEYLTQYQKLMAGLITNKRVDLKAGKVLVISQGRHYNRLAILISTYVSNAKINFVVLVLDNIGAADDSSGVSAATARIDKLNLHNKKSTVDSTLNVDRGELWHRMVGFAPIHKTYVPEGVGGHTILTIEPENIVEISKTVIKVEADTILNGWKQRQIPRFKNNPVGPSTEKAVTELYNLNQSVVTKKLKLQMISFKQEFKMIQDMDLVMHLNRKLAETLPCTEAANFEQEFAAVFDRKELERKQTELRFKMSNQNLTLYPEYQYKLEILTNLNYIDQQHSVTIKGRVACEMGSNELMITELVLCNTFTDLDPAEIAALLSSLVFQGKTESEIQVTDKLKTCIEMIKSVDTELRKSENEVMADLEPDVRHSFQAAEEQRLNFGLVQVVYEWARNKPFAEIMTLTDVQEGVIVRCIQQLNETLQDVKDAARIIGSPTLQQKMEEASNAIKRDIVFAASLYFQD